MAQKTFRCRLITPDAQVFDAKATSAVIPAWDGQFGILPDRAAFVAKLGPGELRLDFAPGEGPKDVGSGSTSYFVEGGFAHMVKNDLTLLASKAIPAAALNESEAQAELAEVSARRTDGVTDPAQVERLRLEKERATAKVRAARHFRGGGN